MLFLKYTCMCVYLYIQINYTHYIHILCKHKLLFWMRIITINHCPSLLLYKSNINLFDQQVPEQQFKIIFWTASNVYLKSLLHFTA